MKVTMSVHGWTRPLRIIKGKRLTLYPFSECPSPQFLISIPSGLLSIACTSTSNMRVSTSALVIASLSGSALAVAITYAISSYFLAYYADEAFL